MNESIRIRLGEQEQVLPRGLTLAALLDALGHLPTSVATAVNGRFVPRGERAALVLLDGDAILLFQPIVGG